jgi:hypothetical protein
MKMKFLVLAGILSVTGMSAKADQTTDILQNSIVTNTFALLQSKHNNTCTPTTAQSIHWYCTGMIPSVSKLTLITTGCGFSVDLKCGNETTSLSGRNTYMMAVDQTGVRQDISGADLGLSFDGSSTSIR